MISYYYCLFERTTERTQSTNKKGKATIAFPQQPQSCDLADRLSYDPLIEPHALPESIPELALPTQGLIGHQRPAHSVRLPGH